MTIEYLIFDLLVLAPIIAVRALRPKWMPGFLRPAIRSTAIAALPFIIWDVAVTGRHWWFNAQYVLPLRLGGLPLEELGFFLVVPLACVMLWELAFNAHTARPETRVHWLTLPLVVSLAGIAVWALTTGREYTALSSLSVIAAVVVDWASGTRLFAMKRAWWLMLAIVALSSVFNGYLTARPVVLYDEAYQVPFRIFTIPIEDYGFGLSLTLITTALYQRARGRRFAPSLLGRVIEWKLGGYRQLVHDPNTTAPEKLSTPTTVAVIGGGLAGLTAAELLSQRGFTVTLYERQPYLGGKLASWVEDGEEIEHGFHAFFGHYYNLLHWLETLGVRQQLTPIADYLLLGRQGEAFSFRELETTPALNLLALKSRGLFRWREVMKRRTGDALRSFLEFNPSTTSKMDRVSFRDFAQNAALPQSLKLVFTMFSRAFFADDHRISMAELVKSFHFYFLSNDRGLIFEHLTKPTRTVLIAPIVERLKSRGATIKLNAHINRIDRAGTGFQVDDTTFDHVVLASDVRSTRELLERSPTLTHATPQLSAIQKLRAGQRYAVLRVWCDGPVGGDELPAFVSTERKPALDAFAFAHRVGAEAHGGAVLELHCYAVPDALSKEELSATLEAELAFYLPGFAQRRVTKRHLQVRDDFTAFHVGQLENRPQVSSGLGGLCFAGDWVALPFPAMLMEAAHLSARLAANELCAAAGVRTFPVWSVPQLGLLTRAARGATGESHPRHDNESAPTISSARAEGR